MHAKTPLYTAAAVQTPSYSETRLDKFPSCKPLPPLHPLLHHLISGLITCQVIIDFVANHRRMTRRETSRGRKAGQRPKKCENSNKGCRPETRRRKDQELANLGTNCERLHLGFCRGKPLVRTQSCGQIPHASN